ncbi:MAG: HNH endonuclease [Proteobacteria bacterium]|nr:HNH endonuclease [Pseudomonadota bacterium]
METFDWQTELRSWCQKQRGDVRAFTENVVLFFRKSFENTRCPHDKAWFGIHKSRASLMVGNLWLSSVRTSGEIGLMLNQYMPDIEALYKQVIFNSSHDKENYPLIYAEAKSPRVIPELLASASLWESFRSVTQRVLTPSGSWQADGYVRRNEDNGKRRLSEFWLPSPEKFYDDVKSDIENIWNDPNIRQTEKTELVNARIGQGIFRQKLLRYWKDCCAVTGYKNPDMLIASHIKPWSASSNAERLDPFNGLLLTPNLDRAFDKGFITFDEDGVLAVSPLLTEPETLGIVRGMRVVLQPQHRPFMAYHREHVYLMK